MRSYLLSFVFSGLFCWFPAMSLTAQENDDETTMRIFVFAGQSNMVGSDSNVRDIKRFPPYSGLERPQEKVLFTYCIGRESKKRSDGWVALQHVTGCREWQLAHWSDCASSMLKCLRFAAS